MNLKQREQNIEALIAKGRKWMALQGKSLTTERQYLHFVRRFLWFTYSQPRELTSEKKFENWLTHLVLDRDVAESTQNVAFNAVCWFYKVVMERPMQAVDALRATKPERVRTALPIEDVVRLLGDVRDVSGYPTRLVTRLLYSCGMRLSDAVNLRVKDIGFARREITIRGGKGKKDRVLGLPADLVEPLQRQLIVAHQKFEQDAHNQIPIQVDAGLVRKYPELPWSWHWAWVFPQHFPCKHPRTKLVVRYRLPQGKVQQAVRESRRRLNLDPAMSPHNLRHSFATHLLEAGQNPKALQVHMGHNDVRTTLGYCHAEAKSVPDPLVFASRQAVITVPPFAARRFGFATEVKSNHE